MSNDNGSRTFVLGGTSGIGRALAHRLAGNGARVIACGRREPLSMRREAS